MTIQITEEIVIKVTHANKLPELGNNVVHLLQHKVDA